MSPGIGAVYLTTLLLFLKQFSHAALPTDKTNDKVRAALTNGLSFLEILNPDDRWHSRFTYNTVEFSFRPIFNGLDPETENRSIGGSTAFNQHTQVLFFTRNQSSADSLLIFTQHNHLFCAIDLGHGVLVLSASGSIQSNRYNYFQLHLSGRLVRLALNGRWSSDKYQSGFYQFAMGRRLYVGGHPDFSTVTHTTGVDVRQGFFGCIKEVKINSKEIDFRRDQLLSINTWFQDTPKFHSQCIKFDE